MSVPGASAHFEWLGRGLRGPVRLLASLFWLALAAPVYGAGTQMFSTVPYSTGEKPQSKLWYRDGSYWGILQGPDGVAFYDKVGSAWQRGQFVDAELAPNGQADVKWNGTNLFVLNYASTCQLFKYTYDTASRVWLLLSGFPVAVPNPSGSETMVLEQDSSGRLWTTAKGGTDVNVYYSTSADHRSWSSTPVILRSGINADDISSIVAFGGNKVGVFWSDQNRDEFGFCVHQDSDPPTTWGAVEIADSGSGHADDHVNLACDSSGRVYAITKDAADEMAVHRRAASGGWTTKTNVLAGIGTRGIIMVAEADAKVYILYTRWGVTPERIEYRVADISTLAFGGETDFISSGNNMNNVTGMKQLLPPGSLVAVAEDGSDCWFNGFGSPQGNGPGAPADVTATLLSGPVRVQVAWSPPASGPPDGYEIFRQQDGGSWVQLNGSLITGTSYTDSSPPLALLCYQVRAVDNGVAGSFSTSACADNSPLPPPGPPVALSVDLQEMPAIPAAVQLGCDEGSGQTALDASGNGNHARLGSSAASDSNDPLWVAGVSGTALQFDGSNDYIEIADSPSLDMPGSFTVEAWARHDGGTGTIVNKGGSGQRTYRVQVTSAGDVDFRWENTSGSSRSLVATHAVLDAAWHHVACVYDQAAGANRIYVDGALAASGSASGTPASNSQALNLGARYSSSFKDFWDGALDGVRIAPAALYAQDFAPAAPPGLAGAGATPVVARGERSPRTGGPRSTAGAPPALAAQRAHLVWQAPQSGSAAASYNVYRALDGGGFTRLNATAVLSRSFDDVNLIPGQLCYRVTAVNVQALEGPASASACTTVLPPPPGAPQNLKAALIILPAGAPPGAAAYDWDEATKQSFVDDTGHGHTGQLGSTAGVDEQDPRWAGGAFAGSLRFDGIDDRARIPDAADLRFAASFTLEAWLAAYANGAARCVLAKGKGAALNYTVLLDDSSRVQLRWQSSEGAPQVAATSAPLSEEAWHHVACVFDQEAGENRIYVDGALAAQSPASGTPVTSTAALYLGVQEMPAGFATPFAGYVDLLRLSPGALYAANFAPPHTYGVPQPEHIDLTWEAPASGAPGGYNVYRQDDGGAFVLLDPHPVPLAAFSDPSPPAGQLCYQVTALDTLGQESDASGSACAQITITAAPPLEDDPAASAGSLSLQAMPNPVRSHAVVALRLPTAGRVQLDVYDVRGQRVARVCNAPLAAGRHTLRWDGRTADGRRAAAGVYWLVVEAPGARARTKIVLIK